ncbi:MAG: hypothetical protein JW731_11030 [Bacteroidales bacterium]|nr:hypothetical protein [Bacteroidales bacterium]
MVNYFFPLEKQYRIKAARERSSGAQSVTVPATFAGDELHCYIASRNKKQSAVSNSTYLGEVLVS